MTDSMNWQMQYSVNEFPCFGLMTDLGLMECFADKRQLRLNIMVKWGICVSLEKFLPKINNIFPD